METSTVGYGPGVWGCWGLGGVINELRPEAELQHSGDHLSHPLPQDYELFVEAVEQNTLQEFLKLA